MVENSHAHPKVSYSSHVLNRELKVCISDGQYSDGHLNSKFIFHYTSFLSHGLNNKLKVHFQMVGNSMIWSSGPSELQTTKSSNSDNNVGLLHIGRSFSSSSGNLTQKWWMLKAPALIPWTLIFALL